MARFLLSLYDFLRDETLIAFLADFVIGICGHTLAEKIELGNSPAI